MPASRVEPVGAGKYDPQAGRDEETVSRADYLALLARFEKLEQQLSKQAPNAEEDLSSAPGPLKRDQSAKMGALWAGARQEAVGEIDCTGKDNIYGFCYEAVLNPKSSMRSIVVSFAYLVIMTLMQLLLAYGALDAARLLHTQGQFEAYMPPLDNSFFYPDTLVGKSSVTMNNLLVSLVCIFMLTLVFKTDNESILLTVCPLEQLLLPGAEQPKSLLRRAGLGCRIILLQAFWAMRLFMAPMCLMSSAYIFADANTALDNVMNAVAVGFIVEIDDFLYAQFLTAHDRSSYESEQASSPRGSFAQIVPGGALVVSLCTASVFFLDFTMATMGYLCVSGLWDSCNPPADIAAWEALTSTEYFSTRFLHYESFIIYVIGRAVIFAAGEIVVGYLGRRTEAKAQGQTPKLIGTLALYGALIVGSVVLWWAVMYTELERRMGMRKALFDEPEINACLLKKSFTGDSIYSCGTEYTAVYDETQCLNLHSRPVGDLLSFQQLGYCSEDVDTLIDYYKEAMISDLNGNGCYAEEMAMTWGSYPNESDSACGGAYFCDESAGACPPEPGPLY
jgi:hypothetical protein